MPSTSHTSAGHGAHPPVPQEASADAGLLSRLSLRLTAWAERWRIARRATSALRWMRSKCGANRACSSPRELSRM
ncbi:hypothetical protein ET532_029140 [Verminephrobacter sp. Larva24]|nr:hypothetical protein ET532_029140 [Verminephrobacter sp. Larva24]